MIKNTEMVNSTNVHNVEGVSLEISVEGLNDNSLSTRINYAHIIYNALS